MVGADQPAPRSASSSAASVSASYAPMWRRSPTKNVGVPRAPLASALATSRRTRWARRRRLRGRRRSGSTSRPSSAGVADEILELQLVLVAEEQVVHLPEAALRGRPPRRPARPARRAGARRPAADGGTRSAGRRRIRSRSSRTMPVARPQNGHSKSPYSTSVSGASRGAADVVARRDRRARRGTAAASACARRAARRRPGRCIQPGQRRQRPRRAASPTVAWSRAGRASKARSAISSDTVNPMPDSAAPPSTWPGPDALRKRRPRAAAPEASDGAPDADELADHERRRRRPR